MRKYKRKSICNYVCPFCFNQIEDCTCDFAPYSLIMVDNNLQEAVRKLNQKRYFTVDCCEGHYNFSIPNTYISFVRPVKLPNFPIGFDYEKEGNVIRKIYNVETEEEFKEAQREAIQSINDWVDAHEER